MSYREGIIMLIHLLFDVKLKIVQIVQSSIIGISKKPKQFDNNSIHDDHKWKVPNPMLLIHSRHRLPLLCFVFISIGVRQ